MPLTEDEKLKRDIETLKESIALDEWEMAIPHKTAEEKAAIRQHIAHCAAALKELKALLGSKA